MSAEPDTYPTPEHGWTCFHCGEHFPGSFAGQRAAREHFGQTPDSDPACLIKGSGEYGLLRKLRFFEQESKDLRHQNEELDHQAEHAAAMEGSLTRLFKGARSVHQAFLEYDSMEGRALAAEEKLAEATAKGDAEMERVKACEHIALGDEGWEALRNECPSTAAVGWLRDQLAETNATIVAMAAVLKRARENFSHLSPIKGGCNPSTCSACLADATLANLPAGAKAVMDVVEAARDVVDHRDNEGQRWPATWRLLCLAVARLQPTMTAGTK